MAKQDDLTCSEERILVFYNCDSEDDRTLGSN